MVLRGHNMVTTYQSDWLPFFLRASNPIYIAIALPNLKKNKRFGSAINIFYYLCGINHLSHAEENYRM